MDNIRRTSCRFMYFLPQHKVGDTDYRNALQIVRS